MKLNSNNVKIAGSISVLVALIPIALNFFDRYKSVNVAIDVYQSGIQMQDNLQRDITIFTDDFSCVVNYTDFLPVISNNTLKSISGFSHQYNVSGGDITFVPSAEFSMIPNGPSTYLFKYNDPILPASYAVRCPFACIGITENGGRCSIEMQATGDGVKSPIHHTYNVTYRLEKSYARNADEWCQKCLEHAYGKNATEDDLHFCSSRFGNRVQHGYTPETPQTQSAPKPTPQSKTQQTTPQPATRPQSDTLQGWQNKFQVYDGDNGKSWVKNISTDTVVLFTVCKSGNEIIEDQSIFRLLPPQERYVLPNDTSLEFFTYVLNENPDLAKKVKIRTSKDDFRIRNRNKNTIVVRFQDPTGNHKIDWIENYMSTHYLKVENTSSLRYYEMPKQYRHFPEKNVVFPIFRRIGFVLLVFVSLGALVVFMIYWGMKGLIDFIKKPGKTSDLWVSIGAILCGLLGLVSFLIGVSLFL